MEGFSKMARKRSRKQVRAIHAKKKHKKNGKAKLKGAYFGADYFKGKAPAGNGEAKGFYQGNDSVL